jgi:uncharacterized RDD family membrane protein YckC
MSLFNRVTLQTPESVELEFTLAGIGNRVQALVIDYLIWGGSLILLLVIWGVLSVQLSVYLVQFASDRTLELWLAAISMLLVFSIYVGYFAFFETLWQGQTPGKRYAKIRVIRENGQPAGLAQATIRALLRPIDDVMFLGALLIILTRREKRLGDWFAGTIVVQEERPTVVNEITLPPEAQALATELLARAALDQLLPDDFAVIREYLQRRSQMDPRARETLSLQLARQIRELIQLQELPFKMTPDAFLEGIYLAYQRTR